MAIIGGITVMAYLAAIALTPAHAPNSGSTGVRIIHYATVNRSQLLASDLLFAIALAVLTVFAAGLYRIIRRAEGQDGWLAIASLASVVAGAGIFEAGTALFMVVAYRPVTDPAVVRAFWDAGWLAYNSAGFAFVAWIVIVVVVALRNRALPPWTAWIGVPVALINHAGPFAVSAGTGASSPQGWIALVVGLTFAGWLLAISLAAWRSARPPAAIPTAVTRGRARAGSAGVPMQVLKQAAAQAALLLAGSGTGERAELGGTVRPRSRARNTRHRRSTGEPDEDRFHARILPVPVWAALVHQLRRADALCRRGRRREADLVLPWQSDVQLPVPERHHPAARPLPLHRS